MLTKDDLKEIRGVVNEEVRAEIDPLKKDVSGLKSDVSGLKAKTATIEKGMKTLQSDVTSIRKDVKSIVSFFDSEYLELRKRVEKIELHLGVNFSS
jgi:peptidoglycan hydrolase CwlO-like protein